MKIKPYETELCRENAYWMAKLSSLVYRCKKGGKSKAPDSTSICKKLKGTDREFVRVHPYDNKSSQAILVEHEQFLCMVFRGTDQIRDWFDNLDIQKRQALFGVFHEGFWEATQDIWPQIYRDYQHAYNAHNKTKRRPLFITGHSLGGAMATIAAARMIHEDSPFVSVYTFGQPRAMDRETQLRFNAECKDRFYRFCNNMDIVTRIPTRANGFTHVGQSIYIDDGMEMHRGIGRWQQFIDAMGGAAEKFVEHGFGAGVRGLGEFIRDHKIGGYIQAVGKWNMAK